MESVEAIARLKNMGLKTVLLARGGKESYGWDVINRARSLGLIVREAVASSHDHNGYLSALTAAMPADIIDIRFRLPLDFLVLMYRAVDAVLANSSHEPFGIVGLEAMAAGGVVFTGSTGEDYSIPFVNSFMIETADPMEIVSYVVHLRNYPEQVKQMRNSARFTSRYFTWEAAVQNLIGKLESQGRIQGTLSSNFVIQIPPIFPLVSGRAGRIRSFSAEAKNRQNIRNNRCLSYNK
jgi:glycosyltransferase involved in cell wall biosynthesis